MPRARVAFAAALVCAAVSSGVEVGCTLSDEYSSEYVPDSGDELPPASLDSGGSPGNDATATSDSAVPGADSSLRDVAPDVYVDAGPGPWGDYCYGIPTITAPADGGTVGRTFQVALQAPSCIKTMRLYLNSNPNPVTPVIEASTYEGTLTVNDPGQYYLNANAWNGGVDAHVAERVYFYVAADY